MLFQTGNILESEKERNFYYKVFAGYYFNELIQGYESRLHDFVEMVKGRERYASKPAVDRKLQLDPASTHVTFDFHGYILDEKNDRGELADILIADLKNKSAMAIEVKFLSDWDFDKDIATASKRFKSLLANGKITRFAQVLLLTGAKLEGVKQKEHSSGSNWKKLSGANLEYPLAIITWEDIQESCRRSGNETVDSFIEKQINETRESFRRDARVLLNLE